MVLGCAGYTTWLRRLYNLAAQAIQLGCAGYTTWLRQLYNLALYGYGIITKYRGLPKLLCWSRSDQFPDLRGVLIWKDSLSYFCAINNIDAYKQEVLTPGPPLNKNVIWTPMCVSKNCSVLHIEIGMPCQSNVRSLFVYRQGYSSWIGLLSTAQSHPPQVGITKY
jgi:hypothetical protein